MIIVVLTLRKRRSKDRIDEFLHFDTSNTLRAIAIFCLIFGHFAIKCIDGEYFFEFAGKWAVIIFLYVSGVALTKTYGMMGLTNSFVFKRTKKLLFPTWITLSLFFILGIILSGDDFSKKQIILNFMLIIAPGPPNGPAWFISYIIFLYCLFFGISRIPLSNIYRIICLLILSYTSTFFIWENSIANSYFSIWTQYTIVFPFSVFVGLYRDEISTFLSRLYKFPVLYFLFMILMFCQYLGEIGVYKMSKLIDSWIYSQVIGTMQPLSFILFLVLATYVIDKLKLFSIFLNWIGKYSFEIFLIHMPFMVYYDFFLFRKPLSLLFFIYLSFILFLSVFLNKTSYQLSYFVFERYISPNP
jgi:peptidoglycan/LPS O-acetylase OafA/YrhL